MLKRVDQVTPEDVFENLMNAYARTYDPHSNYFGARNSRNTASRCASATRASEQPCSPPTTTCRSSTSCRAAPAAVAGTLNINDRIMAISQGKEGAFQEVIGWRLDDVVQLIRGKNGSLVRLQVLPAGAAPGSPEKIIEFTRGKVTLENQAAKKEKRLVTRNGRNYNIGVINVPGFYQDVQAQSQGEQDFRSTTRDVRKLLDEFQKEGGIDGLVLDLRGDGGGYLPEATALTGLFIDKGPVVQLKDYTGRVEVLEDPNPGIVYDGPLVVLVDRASASASEIFAGAIQDYHRGYIIGQRTFGKGTVQNLVPLDRWSQRPVDGQLTVTIGKFYRVTGREHAASRRRARHRAAPPSPISLEEVGERRARSGAALGSHRRRAVPDAAPAEHGADRQHADEGRRRPQPERPGLPLVRRRHLGVRDAAQAEDAVAEPGRPQDRTRAPGCRAARAREPAAFAAGQAPLKSNEELEASTDKRPDIVLDQTAQIMGDILATPPASAAPAVARDAPVPARKATPARSTD